MKNNFLIRTTSRFRKARLVFIVALLSLSMVNAQQIDKAFIDVPAMILPSLNKMMRLELVEYYKMGQKDTTQNVFGNNVFVLDYDSIHAYVKIQSSANSRWEMKLFPIAGEKQDSANYIIGVISTVCAPVCSSYVLFYDDKWNPISVNFPVFTAADWLINRDETLNGIKVSTMFISSFIEFSFDKKSHQIIVKSNSIDMLSNEDKALMLPFVSTDTKKCSVIVGKSKVFINSGL